MRTICSAPLYDFGTGTATSLASTSTGTSVPAFGYVAARQLWLGGRLRMDVFGTFAGGANGTTTFHAGVWRMNVDGTNAQELLSTSVAPTFTTSASTTGAFRVQADVVLHRSTLSAADDHRTYGTTHYYWTADGLAGATSVAVSVPSATSASWDVDSLVYLVFTTGTPTRVTATSVHHVYMGLETFDDQGGDE